MSRVRQETRCLFQSAPPAEAEGDSRTSLSRMRSWTFQSAPPAEAEGDSVRTVTP